MKRDSAVLFQVLLSLVIIIAFAGLVGIGLLASARLSLQSKEPVETTQNLLFTDELNQFYDAVVGSERTAEVSRPADEIPRKREVRDVVDILEAKTTTDTPEDQAPSASIRPTATTTLPVGPHSESGELAVNRDAPSTRAAAPLAPPHEEDVNAAVSNELSGDSEAAGSLTCGRSLRDHIAGPRNGAGPDPRCERAQIDAKDGTPDRATRIGTTG